MPWVTGQDDDGKRILEYDDSQHRHNEHKRGTECWRLKEKEAKHRLWVDQVKTKFREKKRLDNVLFDNKTADNRQHYLEETTAAKRPWP